MNRALWMLLTLVFLLAGCPQPPQTQGVGPIMGDNAAGGGEGNQAVPAADAQEPGDPDGGPSMLPPGVGHNPPSEFDAPDGETVTLSGTVTYEGAKSGEYYVDFMQHEEGAIPPSRIVHSMKLDGPGPFEVQAPKNKGKIEILAFIDINSNGPSAGEPMGATDGIDIGTDDVTGINIVITDEGPEKKLDGDEPPPMDDPPPAPPTAEGAAPPDAEPAPAAPAE